MSEFKFDIVHRAGLNHYAADALSRFKTESESKSTPDNKVPALTVSHAFIECAPQTEITDFEFIKEPEGPIIPLAPEVCMMRSITGN